MFIRFNINKQSRPLSVVLAVLSVSMLFSACLKEADLYTLKEGQSYMPQAYQDEGKIRPLVKTDSVQDVTFGFYYTSYNGAPSEITGNFVVDTSLVKYYNEENAYTGIEYRILPDSVYTISGTSSIVKPGGSSSEPLTLAINPKDLSLDLKYMLPIKLVSVTSGTIDTTLSITYFRIDEIVARSKDSTNYGILTGNYMDSPPAEAMPKLVDSNFNSKYLARNYGTDLYVQLQFPHKMKVDAYTITSGNDAPERDPKNFELQGSNDGTTWTTLDTRVDQSFLGRNLTRTFNLDMEAEYVYYRLNISAIGDPTRTTLIQISEWRLLDYY